jgi:hypothetical protein
MKRVDSRISNNNLNERKFFKKEKEKFALTIVRIETFNRSD